MTFPELPLAGDADVPPVEFLGDGITVPAWVTERAETLTTWLLAVAKTRGARLASLTYVLCDDDYLHRLNVDHLGHDTLTDVITFDLRDDVSEAIVGECYISLPRIIDNAREYGEPSSPLAPAHPVGRAPDRSTADHGALPDLGSPTLQSSGAIVGASVGVDAPARNELLRVVAHGLLHLCGLRDKTTAEADEMRAAEDAAIYIWRSRFGATATAE